MLTLAPSLISILLLVSAIPASSRVNVRDFGARGDGRADDSAAFDEAIRAAQGGAVVVPGPGTYVVRAIKVQLEGTRIECVGHPTLKLKALTPGDGAPIVFITAGRVTIHGCRFDGNRAAQPADGYNDSWANGVHGKGRAYRSAVKAHKATPALAGLKVTGCTFVNVYGAAIATWNVNDVFVAGNRFADINFEAVDAEASYAIGTPSYLERFTFSRNTILRAGSRDPRINANGLLVNQTRAITIDGNTFDTVERAAIKLENCADATIIDNTIRNGTKPNFPAISMQNGSRNVTVSRNAITRSAAGIATSYSAGGGRAMADSHIVISDNTLDTMTGSGGPMADGIRFLGYPPDISDIVVSGNELRNVARFGIYVRQENPTGTMRHVEILSNTIESTRECFAIMSDSVIPVRELMVSRNTCRSATTVGVLLGGGVRRSGAAGVTIADNVIKGSGAWPAAAEYGGTNDTR